MHVDGFRFDLAATLARGLHEVDRLSAFFDLIHQDPVVSRVKLIAEPWDVGDGGYQVGNFPPLVVGVERQVSRRRARLLARRAVAARRLRLSLHRLERPLRRDRAAAVRQHQLRHRARRLHAEGPGLVQRQAQRGQRRGEPRRHRRQPLVELRRRGRHRRRRRSSGCARSSSATSWRRCCCRRACRCSPAATSSAARRRGNNNGYCQDNELSWFDWEHVDSDLVEFVRRLVQLPPGPPHLPPAALVPGAAAARHGRQGRGLVHARGAGDVGRALGGRLRQVARRLLLRATRSRRSTRTASASSTTTSCSSSTPRTSRCASSIPDERFGKRWVPRDRHRRARRRHARRPRPRAAPGRGARSDRALARGHAPPRREE